MKVDFSERSGLVTALTFRNNEKLLVPLLEFLRVFLSGIGLSEKKQSQAALVLKEMLTLRVTHAYQGVGMLTLDIFMLADRVRFTVRDKGEPYLLDENAGISEKLVYTYAEAYSMDIQAGKGQSITFDFLYDANGFDVASICRSTYDETTLLDRNITIRPVQDDDAEIVSVIACIYSAYGYLYARDKLYSPDGFRGLLKSGMYRSYVAVNESGQVLAHASLSEGGTMQGMPDLGALVTKPFCRGMHIAERLVEYMLHDAKQLGYAGVRAEPVAFHPYTQKLFNVMGLVPTGFLFHELNPETSGVYRDGDRRLDLALAQIVFDKGSERQVILPQECKEFLLGRFQALGLPVRPFDRDAPAKPDYFNKSMNPGMRLCTIMVSGSDWIAEQKLAQMLRELAQADNVDLYLDMNNPGSLEAYRFFFGLGFFVTGLVAGAREGDYLVMQHLMGAKLDADKVVCERGYREVFAEIIASIGKENLS